MSLTLDNVPVLIAPSQGSLTEGELFLSRQFQDLVEYPPAFSVILDTDVGGIKPVNPVGRKLLPGVELASQGNDPVAGGTRFNKGVVPVTEEEVGGHLRGALLPVHAFEKGTSRNDILPGRHYHRSMFNADPSLLDSPVRGRKGNVHS